MYLVRSSAVHFVCGRGSYLARSAGRALFFSAFSYHSFSVPFFRSIRGEIVYKEIIKYPRKTSCSKLRGELKLMIA